MRPIDIFADLVRRYTIGDGPRCPILVCGGRSYLDKNKVFETLDIIAGVDDHNLLGLPVVIIHGGAKGADLLADQWAILNWQQIKVFHADWKRYDRAAGQVRNRKMLAEGKPLIGIAFSGGKGTAHMVSIMKAAEIPVLEVE